jgi:hypothetical protein
VVTGYLAGDEVAVYVAKIYDGVHYALDDDDGMDCMLLADCHYAVAYWAYRMMQAVERRLADQIPALVRSVSQPSGPCAEGEGAAGDAREVGSQASRQGVIITVGQTSQQCKKRESVVVGVGDLFT